METCIMRIEKKCHEKVILYHDLLTIFRKERKSIINADIQALWTFSSEKLVKAEKIEQLRAEIIQIIDEFNIAHSMSETSFDLALLADLFKGGEKAALKEHLIPVNRLKKQIITVGSVNKLFIEEYLSTINEIVSVVTGTDIKNELYNQNRIISRIRDQETVLLNREV